MKCITFDGRIGSKGAEVLTTRGGKPYVRFSVANNSFAGGQEKTEWYDVTSYDPFVIEKRAQYLTKGTYVIISGSINSEAKVGRDNNIWLNHYVTASTIDTPSFKKKDDDGQEATQVKETIVSTYTAATPTVKVEQESSPAYSTAGSSFADDDDMPF